MTLFEIKEQYLKLIELDLDETTLADTLESLDGDLTYKADNIACLIKTLEAESEAIKIEAKKLSERATQKQAKVDSLKKYLFNTFKALDKNKIETTRNCMTIKKNPTSVILTDGFCIAEYMTAKTSYTPNKALIKEALVAGINVEGARLEHGERLEIK